MPIARDIHRRARSFALLLVTLLAGAMPEDLCYVRVYHRYQLLSWVPSSAPVWLG
jgi:hypothetical protein